MGTEKPKKSYGKRSVRFWVSLYLVAGTIIYVAAYLLLMHKGAVGATGTGYGY